MRTPSIIMLYEKTKKVNEFQGSSLTLPAHGWVGARATLPFLAAHFAKQNTNSVGVQSEGEAEGGCGGNSASPEPKRSPAALLVQSRTQQKSFLFLLEEKEIARQIKKCEENFFAGWRALASGGGAERQNSQSGFSSKKVRISSNKHHHIELVASLVASPLASAGSFASKSKGFLKSIANFPAARRRFTNKICIARRAMSRFFSFAVGERQSEILLNCRCAFPFSITIKE
jgi:hypothetical protein